MVLHVVGDVGRYASALYGVSAVLHKKPDFEGAFLAGGLFAVASTIKYISNTSISTTDRDKVQKSISNLEKKFK